MTMTQMWKTAKMSIQRQESNVSQQKKKKSTGEADKPDQLKRVYRLKQEIPTRWNSCLAMLKSLLQMRKEVDNCIKMIGQYDKCLKASEWAVVEELVAFLSHFQDLTDLVSTKVTTLSLIQLIRREIEDISATSSTDCEEVVALKSLVAGNLNRRLPLTDAVLLATLLDPSTKDLVDLDQYSKSELLVDAVVANKLAVARLSKSAFVSGPSTVGSVAVSLANDITPGHLSAQEHLEQDDVEANNDSKPISKQRRLLMKHRVHVPADDVIHMM